MKTLYIKTTNTEWRRSLQQSVFLSATSGWRLMSWLRRMLIGNFANKVNGIPPSSSLKLPTEYTLKKVQEVLTLVEGWGRKQGFRFSIEKSKV